MSYKIYFCGEFGKFTKCHENLMLDNNSRQEHTDYTHCLLLTYSDVINRDSPFISTALVDDDERLLIQSLLSNDDTVIWGDREKG